MLKPYKRSDGRWYTRVSLGGGKYKYFSAETKKESLQKALAFEASYDRDATANPYAALTVGGAMKKYIASKSNVISPTTLLGYERIQKNYLHELQEVKLTDLTQNMIQCAFNELAVTLSPKTCRNIHTFLSSVLQAYHPDFRLRTTLPKRYKPQIHIPTEPEVKKMVEYFTGTDMELPFMLASFCGMRKSEILGLRWENIDHTTNRIHIVEAKVRGKDGLVSKSPKSTSGERSIRIFPFVLDTIERTPHTSEYVAGELTDSAIYNRFSRALKKLGMPHYRFHDMRHYCVSVMLSLGAPKSYVADYIGHADETMIDRVYGHIMGSKKESIEDSMEAYYSLNIMKSAT